MKNAYFRRRYLAGRGALCGARDSAVHFYDQMILLLSILTATWLLSFSLSYHIAEIHPTFMLVPTAYRVWNVLGCVKLSLLTDENHAT